jgi:hypothetical protein
MVCSLEALDGDRAENEVWMMTYVHRGGRGVLSRMRMRMRAEGGEGRQEGEYNLTRGGGSD